VSCEPLRVTVQPASVSY